MRVLPVNVAVPRPNPWKRLAATGIDKQPAAGPVLVTAPGPKGNGEVGLAGDHAYDHKHHGGADQAVYAYASQDLAWWTAQLDRPLAPGVFGENLTTAGLDVNGALIGEQWRIGAQLLLEVSCPRIPCRTFEGWMGVPGWIERFTRAGRPGAYLRVIQPGAVRAGDSIEIIHRPGHTVTVALSFRALTLEPALLPLLTDATALPQEARDAINRRLADP
jgi:MOSC domain-containing protein YiiM